MANVPQPQLSRLLGTLLTEDSPLGKFIGGTLTDEARMAEMDQQPPIQILPDVNVIKIGAQSMMDRGRVAIYPLLEEIVENLPKHKMILGTGRGRGPAMPTPKGLTWACPQAC